MSSPLRDPSGLLERCPELAELAERSPALTKAIEQGRPFNAYRALFFGQLFGRFGEHRAVAASLLAQRRLFLKPITRAPVMATMNGIGARVYGASDRDPEDGTSVATHYLVFFFVPVFPLASYLVRPSPADPGRAWTFHAKVPLATGTYLWQRAGAIALLFLIASGAAHALEGYRNNSLYLVNGLDLPVTAELSGSPVATVPAHGHVQVHARTGAHRLVVRAGDRIVEDVGLTIPTSHSTAVWNILGIAPVVLVPVIYSADSTKDDGMEKEEVLCGTESFEHDAVDYPFVDPPKSIKMSENSGRTVRTRLLLAPGDTYACVRHLAAADAASAARLGLRISLALMTPASEIDPLVRDGLVDGLPAAEAEAFATALLERDDSVDAHRLYEDVLLGSNQRDRAIREYEARRASHPGADAEYLALRVQPHANVRVRIDSLAAQYPTDRFVRLLQLWSHYIDADFAVVAAVAEESRELDRAHSRDVILQQTEALVALGKGAQARDRLHELARDASASGEYAGLSFLDFRVAHTLTPGDELELPAAPSPELAPFWAGKLRAETGLPARAAEMANLKDDDARIAFAIADDARTDAVKALVRVQRATADVFPNLPSSVATLLLAEAVRTGDTSASAKLRVAKGKTSTRAITEYVSTGAGEEALGLAMEDRAALDFVRSRVTGLSDAERAEARARAAREDVLKGPVSVAMAAWGP